MECPEENKPASEDVSVVLVGAGNVATNLGKALFREGIPVIQVFSRTYEAAEILAQEIGATATDRWEQIRNDASIYIVSLPDDVTVREVSRIASGRENALLVHTAGSVPMQVWDGCASRYGVFYPLQTFSKEREVVFSRVPLFVEANNPADVTLLRRLASQLSSLVYEADSEQRKALHLAAVFSCNFVNHLYAVSAELLHRHGLPLETMLPLIDETAAKVHTLPPRQAQTGPAIRHDQQTMERHLQALSALPEWQQLYRLLSQSIQDLGKEETTTY